MSSGEKQPRAVVLPITERLVSILAPFCERIEIAGSLRRLKPEVGDIELVVIPKLGADPNSSYAPKIRKRANSLSDVKNA